MLQAGLSAEELAKYPNISQTIGTINETLLYSAYPYTIDALKTTLSEASFAELFAGEHVNLMEVFRQRCGALAEAMPAGDDRDKVTDLLNLENNKFSLDMEVGSTSFTYVKNLMAFEYMQELLGKNDDGAVLEAELKLNDSRVVSMKRNWLLPAAEQQPADEDDGDFFTLLLETTQGVVEYELNDFSHLVLTPFAEP